VIIYFWKDASAALISSSPPLRGKVDTSGCVSALCLIIATIPVVIFGVILKFNGLDDMMRNITSSAGPR
jgi:undecaprenyl-diphosphatase